MVSILLPGHGSQVRVDILGFANDKSPGSYDPNWLRGLVSFRSGIGSFRSNLFLTTDDIVAFHHELKTMLETLEGSATFSTIEGFVFVEITLDRRGAAVVSGKLIEDGPSNVQMTFSFDSDQSFFGTTMIQLQKAVEQFGRGVKGSEHWSSRLRRVISGSRRFLADHLMAPICGMVGRIAQNRNRTRTT